MSLVIQHLLGKESARTYMIGATCICARIKYIPCISFMRAHRHLHEIFLFKFCKTLDIRN